MNIKKDIFPIFAIGGIVGFVLWMFLSGFPLGIITVIASLGLLGFGAVEIVWVSWKKKTVSQEWWEWVNKTELGGNKYCHCPQCGAEIGFPNKAKASIFGVIFISIIVVITVGHLLYK